MDKNQLRHLAVLKTDVQVDEEVVPEAAMLCVLSMKDIMKVMVATDTVPKDENQGLFLLCRYLYFMKKMVSCSGNSHGIIT